MYGQESSRQRRSFDDIAAEVDAEFDSPKSARSNRPSFDDIARDVGAKSVEPPREKSLMDYSTVGDWVRDAFPDAPAPINSKPSPRTGKDHPGVFKRNVQIAKDERAAEWKALDFGKPKPKPQPTRADLSNAFDFRQPTIGDELVNRAQVTAGVTAPPPTEGQAGRSVFNRVQSKRSAFERIRDIEAARTGRRAQLPDFVQAEPVTPEERRAESELFLLGLAQEKAANEAEAKRQIEAEAARAPKDAFSRVGGRFARGAVSGAVTQPIKMFALNQTPEVREGLERKAQAVEDVAAEYFPLDRRNPATLNVFKPGFYSAENLGKVATETAPEVAGQMIPQMLVGRGAGAAARLLAPEAAAAIVPRIGITAAEMTSRAAAGATGAGAQAVQAYESARAAGFSHEQALRAAAIEAPIGFSEMFGSASSVGAGRARTAIGREMREEALQEGFQQGASGLSAKYVAGYDPNKPLLDIAGETVGGMGLGGAMGGLMAAPGAVVESGQQRYVRRSIDQRSAANAQSSGATPISDVQTTSTLKLAVHLRERARQKAIEAQDLEQQAFFARGRNRLPARSDYPSTPEGQLQYQAAHDQWEQGQETASAPYDQAIREIAALNQEADRLESQAVESRSPQNADPDQQRSAESDVAPIIQTSQRAASSPVSPMAAQASPAAPRPPVTLFPEAQQHQQPQQDLSALDPQQRAAALLDRLRQQQEGRKAASLEQQLNTDFAEASGMVDAAAQNWDADRATAEQLATTGAARLKSALQNLQKSESFATELGAVASGTGQPGPYMAAAQALQTKLEQAQGLFSLDAERAREQQRQQAEAEKAQRQIEKEAQKQARFAAREEQKQQRQIAVEQERAAIQQKRDEAVAQRLQAAEAAKVARQAQLEQQRAQARDEKAKKQAEGELQRIALHDAALKAADDAGQRHQEYLSQGNLAEAVNELVVQQKQIRDAVRYLPRTPESQNTKADLSRYQGQIGNRIGDLRAQMRGRQVPVTQAVPPLLQPGAVVNPDGGIPGQPNLADPGAKFFNGPLADVSQQDAAPLLTAIRRLGGIQDDGQFSGELRQFANRESGTTGVVNNKTGLKPDRMREALVEDGLLPEGATVDDMFQAIKRADATARSPRQQETIDEFYERWVEEEAEGQRDEESSTETSNNIPQSMGEEVPEGIDPEDWATYQQTLARSNEQNPRPYNERTRPAEPGSSGVSLSGFAVMLSRHGEKIDRLREINLNSPEARQIIAEITEDNERMGIEHNRGHLIPHIDALIAQIQSEQFAALAEEDRQEEFAALAEQRGIVRDDIERQAAMSSPSEEERIEAQLYALDEFLDNMKSDPELTALFDAAIAGDNDSMFRFAEVAEVNYGLDEDTIHDFITGRRQAKNQPTPRAADAASRSGSARRDSAESQERWVPPDATEPTAAQLSLLRSKPNNVPDQDYDQYLDELETLYRLAEDGRVNIDPHSIYNTEDGREKNGNPAPILVRARAERHSRREANRLPSKAAVRIMAEYGDSAVSDLVKLAKPSRPGKIPRINEILTVTRVVLEKRPTGVAPAWMNRLERLHERALLAQQQYAASQQTTVEANAVYPGALRIKKQPGLTEAQRAVEARVAAELEADLDEYLSRYSERFGDRVINADNAKLLFEEFNVDPAQNSAAVQTASSALAGELFQRRVAALPKGSRVAFLAGGPAAGKSVFLQNAETQADLALDTTMANTGNNVRLIDHALSAGQNVTVAYIHRPAADAARGMVTRAIAEGRTVPEEYMARTHFNAQAALFETAERYRDNPRVQFVVVDNSGPLGEQKRITLAELEKVRYNSLEEVQRQIQAAVDEEYAKRQNTSSPLAEVAYRAITGANWTGKRLGESVRAGRNQGPARSGGARESQSQEARALQERETRSGGDRPAGGSGNAGRVSDAPSVSNLTADSPAEPRTITHPNPAIDGQEIIRETDDGRVIVANPENKTGVSIVKPLPVEAAPRPLAEGDRVTWIDGGKTLSGRIDRINHGYVTVERPDGSREALAQKRLTRMEGAPEPLSSAPDQTNGADSYWKTPRIKRDETGQVINPQSIIPDSRAEFRQSTQGAGTLWLNEQATLVIGAAAVEGGVTLGSERGFMGVAMSLPSVRKTLVALRERARQYGAPIKSILNAMEEAMRDAAANHQRAVVMADTATQTKLKQRKQTIREERYHQWQQTHGLLTIEVADQLHEVLAEDPTYQRIQSVLLDPQGERGGYRNDPAILITEASAKMASGQWQEYGVNSETEGLDFLHRYMRAAVEKVGPHILQARIVGTARAQEVFDDVREIKGLPSRTAAYGLRRRGALVEGVEGSRGTSSPGGRRASEPVPSGRSVFQGIAVEGRSRTADGRSVSGNQSETGEVIPVEGEQRISLSPAAREERIPVGRAEGAEVIPIGRQRRPPSSSFESEERVLIESPEVETVPLGQTAQPEQPRPAGSPTESSTGAMSYRQALRTFRQRQKAKEQQKTERAKQARLNRVSLDSGNPLIAAMRGLTDADLDGELSALGIVPAEHETRDDKMRAALLAMQEYQPDLRSDAFDKAQREVARRAATVLGVTEKAAREMLRTANEAITAPKEGREAEYTEAWERLSALSARELDALKWLDSRGAEPLSVGRNPLAATMDRLRAQQVVRGATIKNLIAMGVEQLRKLGRALGVGLPATGQELNERQETEEWAHALANISSAMQKLGAPTAARAKEIVTAAFAAQNSKGFKRSMRTLRELNSAEIMALRKTEILADYAPGDARSVSFAEGPQGEPQKLANAMNRMTAPKRAAAKVQKLQVEEARQREQASAQRRAEYESRPAASEVVQADLDRLARLRRATGAVEPMATRTRADVENSPEFRRWFGDSKIVDEAGKPLVVYHGTSAPHEINAFDKRLSNPRNLYGDAPGYFTGNPEVAGGEDGYAQTKSPYRQEKGSPSVYPVYLRIRNPFDMDAVIDDWGSVVFKMEQLRPDVFFDDVHERLDRAEQWQNIDGDSLFHAVSKLALKEDGKPLGQSEVRDMIEYLGYDGIVHTGGDRKGQGKIKHKVFIPFRASQIKSATGNRGTFDPKELDITMSTRPGGSGTGNFNPFAPLTTPLRSIVTEHQPLFVDPLKLQEAAIEQILKAGASGTLPGARALHWANKLKLKPVADKLANRQADFIQKAIEKTDAIISASDAMQAAKPGSEAYKKARADFYARRRELHGMIQKTGEYAGPVEYLAKYGKAALLSAPHILTNNVLDHLASFPFHEAQKLMGFLLPVRALQRWGVDVERTHVDLRDLVPAMAREFKAILRGTKDAGPDFVNMLRYGTTDLLLDEEIARQQVGDLDEDGKPRTGGADRYDFGKAAKGVPGMDQVIGAIGRTHGAVDVVGRRWAFTTALVSQADAIAKRIGKENGFTEEDITALREDLAAEPSAQMIVLAMDEANRFVLDYPTFLYELLQKSRQIGKDKYPGVSKAWNNALDFVVKFQKIPLAAQAQSLWHFTPMGLANQTVRVRRAAKAKAAGKPISKQESAEIVERLQQGALGSLMWATAGLLGSLGYLQFTGGDDRERARNAEEVLGYGYDPELKVGNTTVQLNKFGTFGRAGSVAARLAKAAEERRDVKTGETEPENARIKRVGKAFMKGVVLDNPVGRGVGELFASDVGDPFENFARGQIRSLQPGILREIAKIADDKKRIPDDSSFTGKIEGDFKSGNPWLRESLQPRLDALGREVEEENPFLPFRRVKSDPQLEEMARLGTGPAKPRRERGETGEEYNRRVVEQGNQTADTIRRIAADPRQAGRSDEARARIYSAELTPSVMKRAAKLSDISVETEREIEALRADAYEALRKLPAYQRMKDSDKEKVRGGIDEQLNKFRARAASARSREKVARMPEFDPLVLARTAVVSAGK